jgi:hypothetical protein
VSRTDVRHRSLLSFAIRVALVVIIVVGAVYWLLLSDLQRALHARLERLYAMGVPRTWAGVAPPEIPDRDNAAVLYVEGFRQLDVSSGPAGIDLYHFLSDRPPGSRRKLRPSIEAVLARNRAALDLIKRGGARPQCRLPIDWSGSPNAVIFNFIEARESARLLAAEALIAAENGDAEQVVESARAGLRMSRHIASEPMLIPFLTGATIQAMTLRTLSDVLQQADLTPTQCRALYDELGRLDWKRYFQHAAATQGCEALWWFETVQRSPREGWDLVANGMGETPGGAAARPLIALYLSPLGKPLRLNEEVQYCDRLERALNLMRKPFPQGPAACKAAVARSEDLPRYWLMSRAFVDPSRVAVSCYRAIAYRNAMQVALALKAYRAKRGQYPGSLAALSAYLGGASVAPEMRRSRIQGWRLPLDPFSGKPFVYHRKGKGFVLYSFGDDLDDDGGRPFARPGLDGDWVWEFRR